MTKRKSKSPREILSRFDDVVRRKKDEGQSSTEDLSIFDVVPAPEENNGQASAAMGAPQEPDYAERQGPGPSPQTPRLSKPKPASWKLAEAARAKQPETHSTISPSQSLSQEMREETRNNLFTRKLGVSTTQQRAMMALAPVLLIILIFLLARSLLAPTGAGGETSKLIVKGILSDRDNPSAIVNNQIVHEGDNISGATVIKINRDSVEFEVRRRWPRKSRLLTRKVQH